ncbi:MAG: GTPase HflX [Chlamydiia bacterium]|nr:GTPase HflX [Chlamydiia bacterium]
MVKRAILIGTYSGDQTKEECEEQLNELQGLADTYGVEVALKVSCSIKKFHAGTFIGKGKIEEIGQQLQELDCDVAIFDDEISPQQQRNLEKIWATKAVIDRTELILAVFAQRAETKEAKIQIELASCRYQMPRLKRLWTHLSRQRTGGAGGGFLKGEGEKQIEIDRRIVRRQIDHLQSQIDEIVKNRQTQRRARERRGIPTFAIIGYTNAGKSTLMKALTDADVFIEDKLFATLDTTTRQFVLPNGQKILLIDTVGFIRKIPHLLVAAFKSTLEEALQADILLHLIDVSNKQAPAQAEATLEVLKELGAKGKPIITVLNKIDRCPHRGYIDRIRFKYPKTVLISATKQEGFDALTKAMIQEIHSLRKILHLRVPQSHYALVAEVMNEGRVLFCEYQENDIVLEVEIPQSLEKKVALYQTEP